MKRNPNASRVKRAKTALADYYQNDPDPAANVTDLLTDLRHYCDSKNLTLAVLDRLAYRHYLVERGGRRS